MEELVGLVERERAAEEAFKHLLAELRDLAREERELLREFLLAASGTAGLLRLAGAAEWIYYTIPPLAAYYAARALYVARRREGIERLIRKAAANPAGDPVRPTKGIIALDIAFMALWTLLLILALGG